MKTESSSKCLSENRTEDVQTDRAMEKTTGLWPGGQATMAGSIRGKWGAEKVIFVLHQTIERRLFQATLPHNVHLESLLNSKGPTVPSFQYMESVRDFVKENQT